MVTRVWSLEAESLHVTHQIVKPGEKPEICWIDEIMFVDVVC